MLLRKLSIYSLIVIIAVSVSTASAKTNIGFYGVGGKLGFVFPGGGADNAFGFGAQADLGTITEDIHLDAFVDYWGKSFDDWSYSVFTFGALGKYYFPVESNLKPYSGGGLGLNIWSFKWDGPSAFGFGSTSGTDLSIFLVGGVEMPISPKLDGVAELKYSSGTGDYFGIFAGVIYRLKE